MSKCTVLFIESGVSGGGSFQSLFQFLVKVDRTRFVPVVVFLNRTSWLEKVRELGVPVYLLFDLVYTKTMPWLVQKRLERLVKGVYRLAPILAPLVYRLCHGLLFKSLARIISKHNVNLVYLNDQIDRDFFGVFVAQAANLPLVSHLRSMNGENMVSGKASFANTHVSTYIANSAVTQEYWVGRGLDPDKCVVVHNAVPDELVEPLDLSQEFGVDQGHLTVGCVARLVSVKNHETLIRAFAQLLKTLPETTLLLAGDGPLETRLRSLVEELGVADNVLFLGFESRIYGLIAALDLLVLPSSFDAFGRVLIEGMQLGVPVVGAAAGGIPEIVEHGVNGMLVAPDDSEAWTQTMVQLLTDEDLRQHCIEGGKKAVVEHFSMERMVRAVEEVMETVLKEAVAE